MGKGDQRQANGSDPTKNGAKGSEDVEMGEDTAGGPTSSINTRKEREGDEMTVVVPPTKGSRLSGVQSPDKESDIAMDEGDESKSEPKIDPKVKAIQGWSISAVLFLSISSKKKRKMANVAQNSYSIHQTSRPTSPSSSVPSPNLTPDLHSAFCDRYPRCANTSRPMCSQKL